MKANVPEKIYVANNLFPTYVDWDGSPINTKRIDKDDIEYIHIDFFINKVCEFLKSYRQNTPDGIGYIAGIVNDETIEDFKNYMKGEEV